MSFDHLHPVYQFSPIASPSPILPIRLCVKAFKSNLCCASICECVVVCWTVVTLPEAVLFQETVFTEPINCQVLLT